MKQLFIPIKKFIISWYIRYQGRESQLLKATKQANKLKKKTTKRYRVFFFGYKYRVWTRQDIKDRKNSGLFKRHLKPGVDFDAICFYDTDPQKGGAICRS